MAIQKENWIAIEITAARRSFKHSGKTFASLVVSLGKWSKIIDGIATEIKNHIAMWILRSKHPVHGILSVHLIVKSYSFPF